MERSQSKADLFSDGTEGAAMVRPSPSVQVIVNGWLYLCPIEWLHCPVLPDWLADLFESRHENAQERLVALAEMYRGKHL